MTPQEIERGLDAHERRLNRLEEGLTRVEENLLVQGEILNRLDLSLARLAGMVEKQQEGVLQMQSAMRSLFERMEAFIKGLERHDGHYPPGAA
jgi:uncharacterized coiled-coil protein SlyX